MPGSSDISLTEYGYFLGTRRGVELGIHGVLDRCHGESVEEFESVEKFEPAE